MFLYGSLSYSICRQIWKFVTEIEILKIEICSELQTFSHIVDYSEETEIFPHCRLQKEKWIFPASVRNLYKVLIW